MSGAGWAVWAAALLAHLLAALSAAGQGVDVSLESFGVGNQARPGDWAGIRITVKDGSVKQRNLIVRLSVPDADGDTAQYERAITSNPGVTQQVWLYARLPFKLDQGQGGLGVSVYEAVDRAAEGLEAGTGFGLGQLLGRVSVSPSEAQLVPSHIGMIGVMGPRQYGLGKYNERATFLGTGDALPLGHEPSVIVGMATPQQLPDRFMGLLAWPVLVWGQGDIAELRDERARAVREWIERGGHLVVVMPAVGEGWTSPSSNALHDIMPAVDVERREGVDYAPLRPLLRRGTDARLPAKGVLRTFAVRGDASPAEAMPILTTAEGDCVVVRRLVGAGAVTLIGLDLNAPEFTGAADVVEADVFWHRVLGRRYNLATPGERQGRNLAGMRTLAEYDRDIVDVIDKRGRSATGLLMGFVVFAAYFLLAGPVGYAVLKRRQVHRHAWVGFVLAAAVFTGVAWGGAWLARPKRIETQHLTFIDHVYGQPLQRARVWASVLIPSYGDEVIGVGDPAEGAGAAARRLPGVIASWDPPAAQAGAVKFPDARGYAIDTRSPDRMLVPTRSTVKQVQVDWSGGPRWAMPAPVAPDGSGAPGVLTLNTGDYQQAGQWLVDGVLKHNLPGDLEDVTIIVVHRQRPLETPRQINRDAQNLGDIFHSDVYAFNYSRWAPGEELSLRELTTHPAGTRPWFDSWAMRLRPVPAAGGITTTEVVDPGRQPDRLKALAVFPYLPAPAAESAGRAPSAVESYLARRVSSHTYDLGRWFTQPCMIVVGIVRNKECPVPVAVGGRVAPSSGTTVVRWVFPFAPRPPAFPGQGRSAVEQPGSENAEESGGN